MPGRRRRHRRSIRHELLCGEDILRELRLEPLNGRGVHDVRWRSEEAAANPRIEDRGEGRTTCLLTRRHRGEARVRRFLCRGQRVRILDEAVVRGESAQIGTSLWRCTGRCRCRHDGGGGRRDPRRGEAIARRLPRREDRGRGLDDSVKRRECTGQGRSKTRLRRRRRHVTVVGGGGRGEAHGAERHRYEDKEDESFLLHGSTWAGWFGRNSDRPGGYPCWR